MVDGKENIGRSSEPGSGDAATVVGWNKGKEFKHMKDYVPH